MASYYYAVQVATAGGDPYDVQTLSEAARAERTRDVVHPFFYPPPFLLAVAWTLPLDLATAYGISYWLDEIFLLLAMLALWRWWRPLGRATPIAIVGWMCLLFPAIYGHQMGQVNGLILALTLGGLWLAERDRPVVGGALMGTACMFKMSPALFVAWWLLRGRIGAVLGAVLTGVLLSLLTLPLLGVDEQLRFYTEILPTFASGDYNGLTIQIGMFANHSIPNMVDQLLPGTGAQLSTPARWISTGLAGLLVALCGWRFRDPKGPEEVAAQISTLFIVALLVPVYTYEHHLVFALPAMVLCTVMAWRGALPTWAAVAVLLSALVLCIPHPMLKSLARNTLTGPLGIGVQEAKFGSLLILGIANFVLAGGPRKQKTPTRKGERGFTTPDT